MIRAMNILFAIALTTGILSGIWGWVAVAWALLSWAGFLGCTAYFACPQGGLKGLAISTLQRCMSGVVWALVIIHGSALAPQLEVVGYVMTGVVAFLMCIQARQLLLLFICAGDVYRRVRDVCRRQGDWRLVCAFAGAGPGIWLRHEKQRPVAGGA